MYGRHSTNPTHPIDGGRKTMSDFKLTYASMFNPPEEVHERFEATLANMKANHRCGCL
jgi:hypothetical protein